MNDHPSYTLERERNSVKSKTRTLKVSMPRVVKHWYRLPKEVVGAPFRETFRIMDEAPSDPIKMD